MAMVQILATFADGGTIAVTVTGKSGSPDQLDDMRRQCHDAWTDAVAYAIAVQSEAVGEVVEGE